MTPIWGSIMRMANWSTVDLPLPVRPVMPRVSPALRVNETSFRAWMPVSGYVHDPRSNSSIGLAESASVRPPVSGDITAGVASKKSRMRFMEASAFWTREVTQPTEANGQVRRLT